MEVAELLGKELDQRYTRDTGLYGGSGTTTRICPLGPGGYTCDYPKTIVLLEEHATEFRIPKCSQDCCPVRVVRS